MCFGSPPDLLSERWQEESNGSSHVYGSSLWGPARAKPQSGSDWADDIISVLRVWSLCLCEDVALAYGLIRGVLRVSGCVLWRGKTPGCSLVTLCGLWHPLTSHLAMCIPIRKACVLKSHSEWLPKVELAVEMDFTCHVIWLKGEVPSCWTYTYLLRIKNAYKIYLMTCPFPITLFSSVGFWGLTDLNSL